MLRWGILSTGNIARQFATSFKTAQHGRLVAVASRTADSARAFASQFAIPTAYASYLELLADPTIDAVYNALPNNLHHTFTLAALRAGKHVLCEKPMATTPAEVQEMFDVARQHGRLLVEAFMYRSHPLTKSYLAAIHAGQIGTVQLVRASFSFRVLKQQGNIRFSHDLAGGVLMDVGCYCIDFARLITAESPNRVHAVATKDSQGIDVLAAATLGHPSGTLATFSVGMTAHADNTATICGTEGYIEVPIPWKPPVTGAIWRLGRSVPTRMDQTPAPTASSPPPSMSIGANKETFTVDAGKDLYALEADDFALAVTGKSPPAITERESIENAQVMARIKACL
jgi:predicted dehydrogenase